MCVSVVVLWLTWFSSCFCAGIIWKELYGVMPPLTRLISLNCYIILLCEFMWERNIHILHCKSKQFPNIFSLIKMCWACWKACHKIRNIMLFSIKYCTIRYCGTRTTQRLFFWYIVYWIITVLQNAPPLAISS